MHRADGAEVLVDHAVEIAAAFLDVAGKATQHADVGIRIDEHLHVEQSAHRLERQHQDALQEDHVARIHPLRLAGARVQRERVHRLLHRAAGLQLLQVLHQKVGVERVRVIEVEPAALLQRHVGEVAVVRVLVEQRDGMPGQALHEPPRHRRLAAGGPAGDADGQGAQGAWRDPTMPAR